MLLPQGNKCALTSKECCIIITLQKSIAQKPSIFKSICEGIFLIRLPHAQFMAFVGYFFYVNVPIENYKYISIMSMYKLKQQVIFCIAGCVL